MSMIKKISSSCKNKGDIKWNFTKFLINREGEVVARFSPTMKIEDLKAKVVSLLKAKSN